MIGLYLATALYDFVILLSPDRCRAQSVATVSTVS